MKMKVMTLADIKATPPPRCPECNKYMHYYGGSTGYVCHGWKILYRAGGWFENGLHVKDDRLAGGTRRVDGDVKEFTRRPKGQARKVPSPSGEREATAKPAKRARRRPKSAE